MSQPCAITTCKRTSRALCYCCQQGLCLQHLKEHNDLLVSQLNPLVDQVNEIGDRLKSITIETKNSDCRQKLERWRMDCHKKIDDLFEQKCQEINTRLAEKMKKQKEEIDRIQSKIVSLIHEEEVSREDLDLLTSTIRDLDRELNKIQHTNFNIEIRPVVIDGCLTLIEESDINPLDISKLPPVYKTISCIGKNYPPLESNGQFLSMYRDPDLCLINRELTIVRQATWPFEFIRSMCWSSSLHQFIIASDQGIFSVDEKTLSIDSLKTVQKQNWFCCTCSDTSLFLSTYEAASSIMVYGVLPAIEFIKTWTSSDICTNEEWISDAKYCNESIALVRKEFSGKRFSIELRNTNTFDRLWSFDMDCLAVRQKTFHCCLLNGEEWLVLDNESDRLLHITKDGKMKSSCVYPSKPLCATMFGPDTIAITTLDSLNFHQF
jgi:hypothetical protein